MLELEIDQSSISKIEQGTRPLFDFAVVVLAEALKAPQHGWLRKQTEYPSINLSY